MMKKRINIEFSMKCETLISQTMKKNQKEGALTKPLSPDYSFSKNEIYFYIGPQINSEE